MKTPFKTKTPTKTPSKRRVSSDPDNVDSKTPSFLQKNGPQRNGVFAFSWSLGVYVVPDNQKPGVFVGVFVGVFRSNPF